jgi:hypothetical protein
MSPSDFRVSKHPSHKDRLICPSGRVPAGQVHCSYIFLTYARSSITTAKDFEDAVSRLILRLKKERSLQKADIRYYGCLERHADNEPHFHLLLSFSKQVKWTLRSARDKFLLPENYNRSVNIVVPERAQTTYTFVNNHVGYIRKTATSRDIIGQAFVAAQEARKDRQRQFQFVFGGRTKKEKFERLMDVNPEVYLRNFISVEKCFNKMHPTEHEYSPYVPPSYIDTSRFVKPQAIIDWEYQNLIDPQPGRTKALILIGRSRVGKTEFANWLASVYDTFSLFEVDWDVKCFRRGHRLCVLHDMLPFNEARCILGCQRSFSAHGRYGETFRFEWAAVPSIWTFNEDNSIFTWPKKYAVHQDYILENAVIVYVDEPLFK